MPRSKRTRTVAWAARATWRTSTSRTARSRSLSARRPTERMQRKRCQCGPTSTRMVRCSGSAAGRREPPDAYFDLEDDGQPSDRGITSLDRQAPAGNTVAPARSTSRRSSDHGQPRPRFRPRAVPGFRRAVARGLRAFRECRRFLCLRPDDRLAERLLPADEGAALLRLRAFGRGRPRRWMRPRNASRPG